MILNILALIVLMAFSAFFSASEIAYASVSGVRLKRAAEGGSLAARTADYIYEHFQNALSAILIGNNLVNIAASSLSAALFIELMGDAGSGVSVAVMTVVVLIFGEITPKVTAKAMPDRFALRAALPLRAAMIILKPVEWVIMLIVKLASLLWRSKRETGPAVSEDELSDLIDAVEDEGVLDEAESELIQNTLEFDDICVYEILTPRVDMYAIDVDDSAEEITAQLLESNYSRLPVYEDTVDNVIGVLHLNHALMALAAGRELDIRAEMSEPCFMHRTTRLDDALETFMTERQHMAIVTDEYGGTSGLVTLEDVLEQLVGDIWDESDVVEDEVIQLSDTLYRVKGDMRIDDLFELCDIDEDTDEEENATVGGWVIEELGAYPRVGDSFDFEHITVTVRELRKRRVLWLTVELHDKPEPEPDDWE